MNYAIIFAGGRGTRMNMGDKPKQFLEIEGKPILCHTVDKFEKNKFIDGIILVSNADFIEETKKSIERYGYKKVIKVVIGGVNPIDSQYNGLLALKGIATEKDVILMHDGVRPLIDDVTITECVNVVQQKGNAITVSPAIETVALIDENDAIVKTVDRNSCKIARAPQCVNFGQLMQYHELSIKEGVHNFIDTASMMLYYGIPLNCVLGPAENIKVTTAIDYYACLALFGAKVNQ